MASIANPAAYLPAPYSADVLHSFFSTILPSPPTDVQHLPGSGQFHLVYIAKYPSTAVTEAFPSLKYEPDSPEVELLLRVSGDHFTQIKTINEAATISWLEHNTSIPVPRLVAYSASKDNVLEQEWILFIRSPGRTLSDVFRTFSETQMDTILDQLIDALAQLHAHPWNHVGGLCFTGGNVLPGPILEESMWLEGEIEKFWQPTESYRTLNILGPFESYTAYIAAHVSKYMHAISVHPSLDFMRDAIPRLENFLKMLSKDSGVLDMAPLRLAHKDLHFGNILVDPSTARITCIIDWEFAAVVPYTRWNPSKAFLWNGLEEESALEEKRALFRRFKRRCDERSVSFLHKDEEFTSTAQESMQLVQNYLRAIVECCPRSTMLSEAKGWKQSMLRALDRLEVPL